MASGQSMRMLQISDSHLYSRTDARLLGMDTSASFDAVIQLAYEETIAEGIEVAAILATGDITQDGSMASYEHYFKGVSRLNAPVLWLPGNHDSIQFMQKHIVYKNHHVSPCVQHYGGGL